MAIPSATAPELVAILRGGALGDFVLTLPAIAALRAAVRGRVLIIGDPAKAALARPDQVIDTAGRAAARLYSETGIDADLRARFTGCRYLLAYVAGGGSAAPTLAENLRQLCARVVIADPRPTEGAERHIVEHLLEPLAEFGICATLRPPRVPPLTGHVPSSAAVIVHPGSGSRGKNWPVDRYAGLIERLAADGVSCAVLMGPAEAERPELHAALPGSVPRLQPPSYVELAETLRAARLVVGNDSGPGHLAAAVGTATVSVFGPTRAAVWRPLGPRARVVRAPGGDLDALHVSVVYRSVSEALTGAEA